jgi:hypothetical protein
MKTDRLIPNAYVKGLKLDIQGGLDPVVVLDRKKTPAHSRLVGDQEQTASGLGQDL